MYGQQLGRWLHRRPRHLATTAGMSMALLVVSTGCAMDEQPAASPRVRIVVEQKGGVVPAMLAGSWNGGPSGNSNWTLTISPDGDYTLDNDWLGVSYQGSLSVSGALPLRSTRPGETVIEAAGIQSHNGQADEDLESGTVVLRGDRGHIR